MQSIPILVAALAFASSVALAAPTTAPSATQPSDVWTDGPLGRLMLRSFATAPYPHASRTDGYKNSAGDRFGPEHYADSTVGIIVPPGYVAGEAVDYVVHFHGHRNHVSNVISRYLLREELIKSGVNAILLVPQGPLDAPDSGGGKLELDDGGFAKFIADVTGYLKSEGVIKTDRVGTIVLTAHSGGYKVAASILHRGGLTDHIGDVILLDASYGNLEWFADYAKARADGRIVSFHTQHLDDENVELAGLLDKANVTHGDVAEKDVTADSLAPRGVTFVSTTLPHDEVPAGKDYLALALSTSRLPHLPNR